MVKGLELLTYALLLTPLVVFYKTIFPYVFPKVIYFRTIVEVMLVLWVPLAVWVPRYRPSWRHPITMAFTAFLGAMVLSMMLGVDPLQSFWGDSERMMGVLTLVHLYVFFLITTSTFRTFSIWRRVLSFAVVVSLGLSLYGLGQFTGLLKGDPGQAISSTLGNSIYWGGYCLLHIFLGFYLLCNTDRVFTRVFFAGTILVNIVGLFAAGSRGSAIALFVTIGGLSICIPMLLSSKKAKKISIVVIGAFWVFSLVFSSLLFTDTGKTWAQHSLSGGMQKIIYRTFEGSDRVALWNIAFQAFFQKPWFGWGPENFSVAANQYLGGSEFSVLMAPWYDRAHNQHLDVLVFGGGIGFVAYLFFFFALFITWNTLLKNSHTFSHRVGILFLGGFFLASIVKDITAFDSVASVIIFYLVVSFVVAYSSFQEIPTIPSEEKWKEPVSYKTPCVIGLICFVVVGFFLFIFNIRPLIQSMTALEGAEQILGSSYQSGFLLLKKALALDTFINPEILPRFPFFLARIFDSSLVPTEQKIDMLNFSIQETKKSLSRHPSDVRLHLTQFSLYAMLSVLDKKAIEKTEESITQAIIYSPRKLEFYRDTVSFFLRYGDRNKAAEWGEKLVDASARFQNNPALGHFQLSEVYLQAGELTSALKELEQARKGGYSVYPREYSLLLMQTLPMHKKYDSALVFFDQAAQRFPRNQEFQAFRIVAYHKAGERKASEIFLKKLGEQDAQTAKDIHRFLQDLQKGK